MDGPGHRRRLLVTVRPQGLEFEVPRGLLPDALGSLIERFLLEEYAALDVDGAVVVDIGAYIGDSAIYLQRSGARMVFSYEPFPVLADVARRNVARNGLDAVISIACAGVGSPAGTRRASFRPKSSMMSDTVTGAGRDRVSIRAFGDVLDAARAQLKGGRLVCKIDCEGAEREFFGPGLLPESFDAVDELALEWHDEDPSPVIDDLRRRGFSIRAEPTSERVGAPTMIFARRRRTPA